MIRSRCRQNPEIDAIPMISRQLGRIENLIHARTGPLRASEDAVRRSDKLEAVRRKRDQAKARDSRTGGDVRRVRLRV